MASPDKSASQAPANEEQDPKNVAGRVANLPLLSSAYDMVSSAYASTKESHPYVKSVCDAAEKGVKTIASAAATGAQPILSKLEPQISTANEYACRGLDKLEEKLPILQQPTDKVISDTKELVTSTVTGAKDALSSTVSGMVDRTKEVVSGGVEMTRAAVSSGMGMTQSVVSGGVEMTRSTISGGVEMTRSALSSSVNTVGHMVTSGVDAVLGKSEELVDRYLPVTNEELAKLATSMEGFDMEKQKAQQSYYIRLGSLSAKVRHRAYEHSLRKLSDAKQSTHDSLAQLHQTIELIEQVKQGVDQKLQSGQEKLHQMWLEWKQKQTPEAKLEEIPDPKIETKALEVSQGLSNQLQMATTALVSNLQGLPAGLQEKVTLVRQHAEDLRTSFSSATSLQDLSSSILAQSREKVTKARELTEELVDHLVHNAPLSWLVGPFTPSSKAEAEEIEME
ncbi:perilipin-3 [Anolis carolinensis]|uniref:Perilipin n=1 Tax=Anolis carolinensis TaxID=28377 RepID=H9GNE0_ANOCA|nr:PREDICTED: perilipin-3 [Anolis carolinensis]|eukprot:XP_008121005.1 PREDICTED: perilipin-3 [Anolis carolinensis]